MAKDTEDKRTRHTNRKRKVDTLDPVQAAKQRSKYLKALTSLPPLLGPYKSPSAVLMLLRRKELRGEEHAHDDRADNDDGDNEMDA